MAGCCFDSRLVACCLPEDFALALQRLCENLHHHTIDKDVHFARRNMLPMRSAQSASTAIDIAAAVPAYQTADISCLQSSTPRHTLRRSVHASQIDAAPIGKGDDIHMPAAGHSQHGFCSSSDVSCAVGPLAGFSAMLPDSAAAMATADGRAATPCSPYMPPPLGIADATMQLLLAEASRAVQLPTNATAAATAAAEQQPGVSAVGGSTGSRMRKRKRATLTGRQRRAARQVTTAAGHLRLKR